MKGFWDKVKLGDKNDCWEWQAGKTVFGYGSFGWRGGMTAHRASWILSNGEISRDLCVLHKCDNPLCVNPVHLFLGSRADNIKDMEIKGHRRSASQKGEMNGCAKLTSVMITQIRNSYRRGIVTQRILADRFGVDRGTIKNALHGKTWNHIGGSIAMGTIGHPRANFKTQDAINLYIKGFDCKRIASKLGGSFSSVHRRLKPLGILRTQGAGMRLRRI